jgi:hypothetical protein
MATGGAMSVGQYPNVFGPGLLGVFPQAPGGAGPHVRSGRHAARAAAVDLDRDGNSVSLELRHHLPAAGDGQGTGAPTEIHRPPRRATARRRRPE